jgi:hypothetical protein
MRLMKTLGAAAVAVVLATALFGAGSASADSLCKEPPTAETCAAEHRYAIGQEIKAHTGEAKFSFGPLTAKCESDIKGETTENLGAGKGVKGKITTLAFPSPCVGCASATGENLNYKFLFKAVGAVGDGSIVLNEETGGVPKVKLTNCSGLNCIYGAASISFAFARSGEAGVASHITASNVVLQKQFGSSVMCEGTATLTVDYEVEKPLPLWIAKNP